MKLSKRLAALVALAMTAGLLAVIPVAQPAGAVQNGTVPGNVAPSYQTNGTVRAIQAAGGVVYIGGDFTSVRPPLAAPGTGEVTRNRLVALNSSTGNPTSFAPDFNGSVRSLALSPNGQTLYVGGDFTTVNGTTRNRAAAFNLTNGALLPWNPNANGRVSGIAATATNVYLGGSFGVVGTSGRSRVAEVDTANGAVRTGFVANAQNIVYAIALSKDATKLYLAGGFENINGNDQAYKAGVVDSANGTVLNFPGNSVVTRTTPACVTEMKDVKTDQNTVYFAAEGTGGGCFDGSFAANVSDNSLKWVNTCLGATQGIEVLNGQLYLGSHAHDCTSNQSWDPDAFDEVGWSRGLARHLMARNAETGVSSSWFPQTDGGPNGGLGPRTMGTDGTQLFVGGEFTFVNNQRQQGFARFSPSVSTSAPARPVAPNTVALPGGKLGVYVFPPLDIDDIDLTVRLYRTGSNTPIAEQSAHSLFWRRPVLAFVDSSLPNGASATYSVDTVDNSGLVSQRSPVSNSATVGATTSYASAVNADAPSFFWRLGDPAGSSVSADSSNGLKGGVFQAFGTTPDFGQAGAVGDSNTAIGFDGSTEFLSSDQKTAGPSTYSAETWIKTTTTSGGKIIGFGDQQGGLDFGGAPQQSGSYDRQVYMLNDGRIRFGVWVGFPDTLTSPNALNDGQWHHIVATQGGTGMQLFVDGARVGRNGQTSNQPYDGFWRIGGDNLGGWPDQPSSNFFNGIIDEAAVYPAALSTAQVQAHYAASGRTPPASVVPADDYGKAVFNDAPLSYWRLDETSGGTAADASDNGSTGDYIDGVTQGVAGALGSTGKAASFDGATGNVVSTNPLGGPSTYATELWFNTSTNSGGKLIGFGDARTGNSGQYDKQVYMLADGRLRFGVWVGFADTVTSANAYNDGQWHQLVAQQGPSGMQLFVDDNLVDANGQTSNQGFGGYWRIGGDNLGGWPDQPPSSSFAGSIDEVAVYAGPLTAAQIHDHFEKSGRTGPDNSDPSTSITSPADNATLPAGTVTVNADASDNVGVDHVELFVDGSSVGIDNSAPYSFNWTATPGSHSLQTVATDAAANTGESAPISVSVSAPDITNPTTAITSPAEGAQVYGPTTVTASAADNTAVASVDFLVDGGLVGSDSSAPYTFAWNATALGGHTLQSVAHDTSGNVGSSTIVNVVVPNDTTPPGSPGTPVASNVTKTSATLTWTAATDDRGVTGYRVVRDGVVLPGTVAALTFTDTGLTAGTSYSYTVRAVDGAGNEGVNSTSVPVTTQPPITTLFSDLFTGANGASWQPAWTTSNLTGVVDIQNNGGRLGFTDVANAYARAQLTGVADTANSEALFSYQWSATATPSYFNVYLRGSGGWSNGYRPRTGYGLEFQSNSGTVTVRKNVNNVLTNLASVAGAQQVSTAKQWVRLRVSGTTIQFKTWVDGAAEPATWNSTSTDTGITTPGQMFVSLVRGGSNVGAKNVTIDDLTIVDN